MFSVNDTVEGVRVHSGFEMIMFKVCSCKKG